MANANQVIVNGETILDLRSDTVTPATLQKGYTAHDKSGMNITGTLEVPATEEQTVELSMLSGNQIIQPTSGKVMRKVTVQKPATLLPENIKKDVMIGGVAGTLEAGGGGAGAWYVTVTPGTNHSATADKTAAEVCAAYKAGKAVYCILLDAIDFVVPVVLPLLAAVTVNGYLLCFAGSGAPRASGSAPFSLTVTYDGTWHYFRDELVSGELVNSVSSSSTDSEVPSAKCLYDLVGNITAQIDAM